MMGLPWWSSEFDSELPKYGQKEMMGLPWWSSEFDSELPKYGTRVRSLLEEPDSTFRN